MMLNEEQVFSCWANWEHRL